MAKKKAKAASGSTGAEKPSENADIKKRGAEVNGEGEARASKRTRIEDRTDFSRWRMRDDDSRHTWHYLEDDEAAKKWPQTYADKYYLGLPLV